MKEMFDWLDSPAADPYWIGAMIALAATWAGCFVWKLRQSISSHVVHRVKNIDFRQVKFCTYLIKSVHERFFLPGIARKAFNNGVSCFAFLAKLLHLSSTEEVNNEPERHTDGDKEKREPQNIPGVLPIIGDDIDDLIHDDHTSVFGDNLEDRDGIKNNRQSGNNLPRSPSKDFVRSQWRPFREGFDVVSKLLLKGFAIVNTFVLGKG